MNHTYLTTTNYWAPLNDNTAEEKDDIKQINIIPVKQPIVNTKSNKWTRRIERRRLVIDSGATSNFVPEELNLPMMGKSNKEVYLPDNTTLQATYCTLVLILAGALLYGTVSFQKNLVSKYTVPNVLTTKLPKY